MGDGFGLCTADGSARVPLEGVRVTGDILGRGARVKVAQRFANREGKAIEAVYRFPLPESAAVCGFSALVDGRRVAGGVEEREKAFEKYDDAIAAGDGACLLDEERPNVFTLSVGNLPPGAEAVVEIEYVEVLGQRDREVRFALPTTISPRYLPADAPDEGGIPARERIHPEYAVSVPYGLRLEIAVRGASGVESVESPSHPVKVATGADALVVTFAAERAAMDRDFVLTVTRRGAEEGGAWRYTDRRGSWIQLDLVPADADADGAAPGAAVREVVFVLDCSGSMQGDSIAQAKRALEVCLKALDAGCSFNVVRFGSSFQSLFPRPRGYGERSLGEALGWLRDVDADLGGTEVLAPLAHVYGAPVATGVARSVVLLTDGEVGNESEVMPLVRSHAASTRFFCVGIGAGPNDHLVRGLARAGGGTAAFIFPGERIEPRVLAIFRQAVGARVTGLRIAWPGRAEQAPAVPSLFTGEATTVWARLDGGGAGAVAVTAEIEGRPVRWELPVVDVGAGSVPVATLWARSRIRDLEESHEAAGRGSRQQRPKSESWKAEVIALAREFGLSSSLTSWVAVEERVDRRTGEMVLRTVPALVTAGWHGRGSVLGADAGIHGVAFGPAVPVPSRPMAKKAIFAARGERDSPLPAGKPVEDVADRTSFFMAHSAPPLRDAIDAHFDAGLLVDILARQCVGGGFDLDDGLLEQLGIEPAGVAALAARIPGQRATVLRAVHTAIVLAALEARFADEHGTWSAAVRKSRAWLKQVTGAWGPVLDGKTLEQRAKDLVRRAAPIAASDGY